MPTVSVIIPCYNRESYISETIESVLAQTYKDFELIVINDGSTDGSKEVILQYTDRLTFLEHAGGVNRGQSASLNLGLMHCTGKFICILDSDDLFAPEKLEQQLQALKNSPEIGLVYSNGKSTNSEGVPQFTIYPDDHKAPAGPDEILLNCSVNLPSNSMVRRSVLERAGPFSETLRAAHDHDMILRLSEISKFEYINQIHWYYRRHEDSISHRNAIQNWTDGFAILRSACERYPYSFNTRRKRKAVLHFRLGQCYLKERRKLTALNHFLKAGILDPARSIKVLSGRERITNPH